jgi:hypothetical protein
MLMRNSIALNIRHQLLHAPIRHLSPSPIDIRDVMSGTNVLAPPASF